MKARWTFALAAALAAAAVSPALAQQAPQLRDLRQKASYSFGMSMGSTLKKQGVDIDINLLMQGIRDATGGKTVLTEEEAMQAMQEFEKEMIAKQATKSNQFMADNAKRPGVQTTKNGLQYRVLKQGQGVRPKASDVVRVHYKASYTDGTQFESTSDKPFTTPVTGVIPGWQEALQMMTVGSKWQIVVPPALAYGAEGAPPAIPPNSALVFELELVEIAKPEATAPGAPGAAPGASGGAQGAARRTTAAPKTR